MRLEATYTTGGVTFPVLVTAPDDLGASERLPMIVFLHGSGERGFDHSRIGIHGIAKLFGADCRHRGLRVITVSPQCPENHVWNNYVFQLMELITHFAQTYHADRDRISLTGLSMGGFGSWELGMSFPDAFSAIAPICGGGMSWRAELLRDVPVWAFHGEADGSVPIEYSRLMISALEASGGHPLFTVLPGVGHNCWDYAYEVSDLIPWLVAQERSARNA